METADSCIRGYEASRPRVCWIATLRFNQFQTQSVGICKRNHRLPQPLQRLFQPDRVGRQPLPPELCRTLRYGERCFGHLAAAVTATPRARPCEKCEDGSWMAVAVAVIKVVTAGIVEVDRDFDQTQPQHANIKIDISFGIAGNCRDVMNTQNGTAHAFSRRAFKSPRM